MYDTSVIKSLQRNLLNKLAHMTHTMKVTPSSVKPVVFRQIQYNISAFLFICAFCQYFSILSTFPATRRFCYIF